MTTHYEDRQAGVIATLTDGHVFHVPGQRKDALRVVAGVCDERRTQVLSLSSPQTIETDLLGHRRKKGGSRRDTFFVERPEANLLGSIGRRDLLPPSAA